MSHTPEHRYKDHSITKNPVPAITLPEETSPASLVVRGAVENSQDREEQIDHIQIETDRGGNFFLNVVVAHDQLGVDQDIGAEQESADTAVDEFHGAIVGKEGGHEAKDDQDPEQAKHIRHPAGEVIFRLARKQRQSDKDAQRQDQRLQHDPRLVETRNHTD